MTASGKSVANCKGAVLKADKVSCLMPFFKWVRYASLRARMRLPIDMNTKSVRCSMALDAAWVMLALKFIKYCSSSVASDTLVELFPLLSLRSLQLSLHVRLYLK